MKSVIYARLAVSDPQSMKKQIERINEMIGNTEGMEAVKVFTEYGGGFGDELPPIMSETIRFCKENNIHLVVMRDISRLAQFHKNDIDIWFISENVHSMKISFDSIFTQMT